MTRVGILGGGQLARMIALAGHPLGMTCRFLDPSPDACAGPVGDLVVDAYDSPAGLDLLAAGSDVVTFEFESVPSSSAARLAERVPVLPPAEALAIAQDRLEEKLLFRDLGIETPDFTAIDSQADLDAASAPGVLKTRRLGYDGKGQRVARSPADAGDGFAALGAVPMIFEELIEFERELSVIGVRGRDGSVVCYPLVENHHRDGILRITRAPAADLTASLQALADRYVRSLMERLEYVGVLALELFQVGERLIANEIAPRVHNSGHWTIEGAETSQFENHLRAICGLPLGSTSLRTPSTMVNLIGGVPPLPHLAAVEGAHVHLYGKSARPGRKVGHVTITGGRDPGEVAEMADAAGDG